jgi:hypothetical protein
VTINNIAPVGAVSFLDEPYQSSPVIPEILPARLS